MDVTIDHKKLGVHAEIKDLRQRDLEAFGAVIAREDLGSASQCNGANVRAAIQAGWFKDLTPAISVDQVADQSPAVIRLLGSFVEAVYREVTQIPPE